MPDGVFPALVRAAEEREALLEEIVDFGEGQPFAGRVLDRHYDEGDVGVRGFFLAAGARFFRRAVG